MATHPAPRPGHPHPLGATWDGHGVNFALFSAHAETVELCLFDPAGRREIERWTLPECSGQVWHGYLPDARPGQLYGYRVHGPYDPERGHRFNPNKLLIDPYAKALDGTLRWTDAHFGYRAGSPRADLSFDRRDNARGVPKSRVVETAFTWGRERAPGTALADTIVYELHVRGQTMLHPSLPKPLHGTCAGLTTPEVVRHLCDLGVTAVELMPVAAIIDERRLVEQGLRNYWGYNSIAFFAPDPRYLATGRVEEFKTMVKVLHDAGIEVLLDVVYNHTGEGNELGPTLCFRGIDNASYYRLAPDAPRGYVDDTGCGNTLNLEHPRVLQLVLDSLRYWVTDMHVDGFRFDLAAALGRRQGAFDAHAAFFAAVGQDPVLARAKLIAEPWDLGEDGYQLGNFPPPWSEWNDRYRDGVRRFWRGDEDVLPELGRRLMGSAELFERHGRRPTTSLNFITAHDGMTLHDLVSYAQKHNDANGEANNDGHAEDFSNNYGVEGPTEDAAIRALRERQKRNLLATLLLSQGVPMLLAGDELGHSQRGNNNAYCQDNHTTWIDWQAVDADGLALCRFVKKLVALRNAHPVLRRQHYLHGKARDQAGLEDVTWINRDGERASHQDWHDSMRRSIGLVLNGQAGVDRAADGTPLADGILLILINGRDGAAEWTLPALDRGSAWRRLLCTADPEPAAEPSPPAGSRVEVPARCVQVYLLDAAAGQAGG